MDIVLELSRKYVVMASRWDSQGVSAKPHRYRPWFIFFLSCPDKDILGLFRSLGLWRVEKTLHG